MKGDALPASWQVTVITCFLGLLISLGSVTVAQPTSWEATGGPEGGTASALVVTERETYGIVTGGVMRSDDGGSTWENLFYPHPNANALAATQDGRVYVASVVFRVGNESFQHGVAWSLDRGETWEDLQIGAAELVFSFGRVGEDRILATTSRGLYATEGGAWDSVVLPGVPAGAGVHATATHPSGKVAVVYEGTVLTSDDGGHRWTSTTSSTDTDLLGPIAISADGTLLSWSFIDGIMRRSADSGATWSEEFVSAGLLDVHAVPETGSVYAGTRDGLYVWGAEHETWEPDGLDSLYVQQVARIGGELFAATSDGFYRSPLEAVPSEWTRSNGALRRTWVGELVTGPAGEIYAAEFLGPVSYSPDGGVMWERIGRFEHVQALGVDGEGTVFVAAGLDPLWRREADGTWTPLAIPLPGVFALHVTPLGALLAGHHDGIYRSEDRGNTWEGEPSPGASNFAEDEASGALYAGTPEGLYRSQDDGATWEFLGLEDEAVSTVWVRGDVVMAGLVGFNATPDQLLRSVDGGTTWQTVLETSGTPTDFAALGAELYAAVSTEAAGRQLYRSTDEGATWQPFTDGLPEIPVGSSANALTTSEGRLLVATTENGVYRTSLPVATEEPVSPAGNALNVRPFPNPFADVVTFTFTLERTSTVRVTLYDVLGRLVAERVENDLPRGEQVLAFDVPGLRSGTYVAQIVVTELGGERRTQTRRITRIR